MDRTNNAGGATLHTIETALKTLRTKGSIKPFYMQADMGIPDVDLITVGGFSDIPEDMLDKCPVSLTLGYKTSEEVADKDMGFLTEQLPDGEVEKVHDEERGRYSLKIKGEALTEANLATLIDAPAPARLIGTGTADGGASGLIM